MIKVTRIVTEEELAQAHDIRTRVFVQEQHVPVEEELDEYEKSSRHYLASLNGKVSGTARWRVPDLGIKLERFAVLKEFRNKGVGSALVEFVLKEIHDQPEYKNRQIYLHSQLDAMPLYSKFGFRKTGNMFEEAGIKHYKMIKT